MIFWREGEVLGKIYTIQNGPFARCKCIVCIGLDPPLGAWHAFVFFQPRLAVDIVTPTHAVSTTSTALFTAVSARWDTPEMVTPVPA